MTPLRKSRVCSQRLYVAYLVVLKKQHNQTGAGKVGKMHILLYIVECGYCYLIRGCEVKRCLMFAFSPEVVAEPIIHNLGMQFRLVTNIRRADITEEGGWAVLDLEGDEKDIENGIAWATSRGVRIEPADDLVEG